MVAELNLLRREFKLPSGEILPDPDPSMSTEEVKQHYLAAYPQLLNSNANFIERSDKVISYEFKSKVGTNG